MPAALKTPQLEPDFAPFNSPSNTSAASSPAASPASARAAVGASTSQRAPSREAERQVAAPPERSRPHAPAARNEREVAEPLPRYVRRERHHRRFRPTLTAVLCGGALLGQLVLLLWLHGKTLSSARQVEKMDAQIADVSNHIERTQERIAAFDSSPQIKQWAAQKGWKPAEHGDFDDITKADQARAIAQAQATSQAKAQEAEADSR